MAAMKVAKSNLITNLAADLKITKKEATTYFEAVVDGIVKHLEGGASVDISGFGKFDLSQRAARTSRNPRTGEPVEVAASTAIRFKPSKQLKESVNRA